MIRPSSSALPGHRKQENPDTTNGLPPPAPPMRGGDRDRDRGPPYMLHSGIEPLQAGKREHKGCCGARAANTEQNVPGPRPGVFKRSANAHTLILTPNGLLHGRRQIQLPKWTGKRSELELRGAWPWHARPLSAIAGMKVGETHLSTAS
eukprot:6599070-Alexandrium_andersonii.AAC.1